MWPWTVLLWRLREEKSAGSLSWAAISQRCESRLSVSPRWQLDKCDGMNFTVLATSKKLCCQAAADNWRREESNKSAARLHVIHSESLKVVTSTAVQVPVLLRDTVLQVTGSVSSNSTLKLILQTFLLVKQSHYTIRLKNQDLQTSSDQRNDNTVQYE